MLVDASRPVAIQENILHSIEDTIYSTITQYMVGSA